MNRHRNCISDRMAQEYWRDYQHLDNTHGLSFTEYVAHRVAAELPQTYTANTSGAQWYMSPCGHSHPWGAACSDWSATT